MNPKVSIIIPNYNHKPFLQERLDSVFNQSFQDFEVILLDDASTDGSAELLKTYQNHPKVSHLVINTINSGSPFKQWQKGIGLAKGEYLWIAESDDYCSLDFLETLIPLFKNDKVVLAYSASAIINKEGSNLGRHKWADALDNKRWQSDFENSGVLEIKDYLRYRNTITNASAVLFKSNTVTEMTFPTEMKFCGDWKVWIDILKKGDIAYVSKSLNYFRRHNATTRVVKDFSDEKLRIQEYMSIFLEESSFYSRIKNFKKYEWVLKEWSSKKKFFPGKSLVNLKLPIEFLVYFTLKEKG